MSRGRDTTVLVVGLGDLGVRVFNALAQLPGIERLVGATRNEGAGVAIASQATLMAELLAGPRHVSFERIDVNDVEVTAQLLAHLQPEIIVMAASRYTWWRATDQDVTRSRELVRLPYGVWLPLQLVPVRRLMEARQMTGIRGRVVCLPFPDAVGPALAPLGLQPEIGAGNVTEVAAKLRLLATRSHDVTGEEVQVRLVMHHAAERYAFSTFSSLAGGDERGQPPPWHAEIWVRDAHLPPEQVNDLFHSAYPLPGGRESQSLTAAATIHLIQALLSERPIRTNAPAPHGLPGGYPVLVSKYAINLDLPSAFSIEEAIALNERAGRWDGIERIQADGTITFTTTVANATEEVLGLRLQRVFPPDLDLIADELEQRARRLT